MNRQQNNNNDRLLFVPHAFWGQAIPSSSMIVFVDSSLRLFLAIRFLLLPSHPTALVFLNMKGFDVLTNG